jgi:hypothetical protein
MLRAPDTTLSPGPAAPVLEPLGSGSAMKLTTSQGISKMHWKSWIQERRNCASDMGKMTRNDGYLHTAVVP